MNNYYMLSLKLAQQSDITGALNMLFPHMKEDIKRLSAGKLYGLCLYRFGDYEKAYVYLKNFAEYKKDASKARDQFKMYTHQISICLNQNNFKKALKLHFSLQNGSATEKNIEGCLYALCGNQKSAKRCFMQALFLDKSNKQAVHLMSMLKQEDFSEKIKEFFNSIVKWG